MFARQKTEYMLGSYANPDVEYSMSVMLHCERENNVSEYCTMSVRSPHTDHELMYRIKLPQILSIIICVQMSPKDCYNGVVTVSKRDSWQ